MQGPGWAAAALALVVASATPALAQSRNPQAERLRPATGSEAARPCPEYGPKFVRMPGSSVCVRLDGRVRGEVEMRPRRSLLEPVTSSRVTAEARLEARSETTYGPIRAVVDTRTRQGLGEPLR